MSRVVSGTTGRILPCCWTDCERPGDTRHEARINEPRRTVHYVFCSERHKMLWVNSHLSFQNLPSGWKASFGPNG